MEGALMLGFMATQLAVETLFPVWTWFRIVQNRLTASRTARDRSLWLAASCFTFAVAIHLHNDFGNNVEATRRSSLFFGGLFAQLCGIYSRIGCKRQRKNSHSCCVSRIGRVDVNSSVTPE